MRWTTKEEKNDEKDAPPITWGFVQVGQTEFYFSLAQSPVRYRSL